MSDLTVAVVICAYTEERWDDIVAAIDSVKRQTPTVDELVLVIDHNAALAERGRANFTDGITVIENAHQNGLSGARNTGIENTKADIVAFLDDDAEADPGWVAALLTAFDTDHVVGMGGTVNAAWLTARPLWWPREFDWVVGCSYTGLPTAVADIRNPIGANMAVRRSAFTAVGGFSPAIGRVGKHPVGCEETELFIRIHQHQPNSIVRFRPDASVAHKVPGTRANFDYFRRRCFAEGLSKAVVAKLVGSGDALSSERSYSTKILPAGVLRGLRQGFTGDTNGFRRAGAIVAGLGLTTAGYVRGRLDKGTDLHLPTAEVK